MSTTTMWITLLASNAGCGLLGFLFGRMTRATVDIAELAENGLSDEQRVAELVKSDKRRRITALQWIAGSVAVIGVLTAGMGFVIIRNQDALIRNQGLTQGCVAGYSNALADTLEQRSKPQLEALEALDVVMEAVAESIRLATPEASSKVRRAINEYVEVRHRTKKVLEENPLPEAPRDACARLMG